MIDGIPRESESLQAQDVVNAYGAVLADLPIATAYPQSLLPYPKELIRQALQSIIWQADSLSESVYKSLSQAYVILEQFILDEQVEILKRGQGAIHSGNPQHHDWEYADEASQIMAQIKLAMEDALQDIQLFLHN